MFGLIKPSKVFLGADSTRSKVAKFYGLGFLISFTAIGVTAPEPNKQNAEAPQSVPTADAQVTTPSPIADEAPAPSITTTPPATAVAAPEVEDKPAPIMEKTLGLSPQAFRQRFNNLSRNVDSSYRLSEFSVRTDGAVNDGFNVRFGETVAFVGTVSKQSGLVKGIIVLMAGVDSDLARPIVGIAAACMAVNPDVPQEQISNMIAEMIQFAAENKGETTEKIVGQVYYTASATDEMGFMLTMETAG